MATRSFVLSAVTLLIWSATFSLLTVKAQTDFKNTTGAVEKVTTCSSLQFDCGDGVCLPARWRCDGDTDCKSGLDERDCETDCLVYSTRTSVRKICIGSHHTSDDLLFSDTHLQGSIAQVEVDATQGCVYHTEISDYAGKIQVSCLDKAANVSTSRTILHSKKISRPEGLSRDWTTGNLYWLQIDRKARYIGVTSPDGKFTKVLYNGTDLFDKPRGLVVHPGIGQLFWTDWSEVNPRIVRASMNGNQSSVTILGEGTDNFGWVNGIALDFPASKLFWIDAKLDVIGSMNLDGSDRVILVRIGDKHPFGITVSEDYIYWTDWSLDAIFSVSRANFSEIKMVRGLKDDPLGIALWAEKPLLPTAPSNRDEKCPYLQLLGHNSTIGGAYSRCYCPDGFSATYDDGHLDCEVDKLLESTGTRADCLVYSDRRNIVKFCLGDPDTDEILLRVGGVNIVAVDVDFTHKCVYYGDLFLPNNSLEVVCLNDATREASPRRVLIRGLNSTVEGIAYDWVTDNLYWLGSGSRQLSVITKEERLTKVLYQGTEIFHQPRDLAVHPGLGQLFWTDWSNVNPRIVRASMNGDQSSVTILAEGKDTFAWVNGIALDIPAGRVYWTDAKKDLIGSMNMDGSDLRTFKVEGHAFSIAVSSGFIYWSDWEDLTFYAAPKTNVTDVVALKKAGTQPMGIALWTERPPVNVDQLSQRTNCPYLWLLGHNNTTGSAYGQCYCPDGFSATHLSGQLKCDKRDKMTEASTAESVNAAKPSSIPTSTNSPSKVTTPNPPSIATSVNSPSKVITTTPSSKLNTTKSPPTVSIANSASKFTGSSPSTKLTTAGSPSKMTIVNAIVTPTTTNSPLQVTSTISPSILTKTNSLSNLTTSSSHLPVNITISSSKLTATYSLRNLTTTNFISKVDTVNSLTELNPTNSPLQVNTSISPPSSTKTQSLSKLITTVSRVVTANTNAKLATTISPLQVTTGTSPLQVTTAIFPSKVATTNSASGCTGAQFDCGDGICIPALWRCNRKKDCPSGLDEEDCVSQVSDRPKDCLLCSSTNELHRICLGNHTSRVLVKSRKVSVMDVDVDHAHRCIFYTAFDSNTYSLQEFCYQRWEKFTPVVNISGTLDGLAYDWAGQNIYWLEITQKVLMVTDRKGRHRATLYSGQIFDEPRDLVLNPEKGDLFWADSSNTNPAIMQASMAGDPSSVRALVKTNLGWPNGLALDTKINQLYWTDGKLDKIMMLDLNANRMREVRNLRSVSHQPFGITISDKFIYWTDKRNHSVLALRKDVPQTSDIITVVKQLDSPNRVAVIPEETKAPRWCSKVCPHLCLTSYNVTTREPDHVCRCADGFLPGRDSCGHPVCFSNSTTAPMTTEIITTTTAPLATQPTRPIFPFTFTTIEGRNYTELTFTCRPLRLHRLCPVQCQIQVDFEDGQPCLKCVCL